MDAPKSTLERTERVERWLAIAEWLENQSKREANALGIALPEAIPGFSASLALETAADLVWHAGEDAVEYPRDGIEVGLDALDKARSTLAGMLDADAEGTSG